MTRATRPRAGLHERTTEKVVEWTPIEIEKTAADFLVRQVPGAPRWKLLGEVAHILKAWAAVVEVQRSRPSSQTIKRRAQKVALHVDRLFTAMQLLNVGEGEPEPFSVLDWRLAQDSLLKIAFAASLIAPPNHKQGDLLKFITSSPTLPLGQALHQDRMRRHKPPNWPLRWAISDLVRCFQRHNTEAKDAKAREHLFVRRALEAGGLLPKGYSVERLLRDYLRHVRVGPEGFPFWQP